MEMNGEILPILEAIENDFVFHDDNLSFGQEEECDIYPISAFTYFVDPECFYEDAEFLSMLYSNMDVIL